MYCGLKRFADRECRMRDTVCKGIFIINYLLANFDIQLNSTTGISTPLPLTRLSAHKKWSRRLEDLRTETGLGLNPENWRWRKRYETPREKPGKSLGA